MRSVVVRSVVMRRMTVHNHITKNNDISVQFLYFTSHNKQYCNNTKTRQSKNVVHVAKHDAIHTTYNTQSGPVYLSCLAECRRLSLLLKAQQQARKRKGFSRVIYYTWAADGGCEMFLQTVNCGIFCKLRSEAQGIAVVLEGQDS
jgi:hypothetical protein